uniref:doublecortin domain-containing protein 2-like n=1 Tax=Doryrhamphus excisus TaxID=161450 RepID=UPI0025AE77D5|nr:doublecortin domain-containing protein 2-like [Doryrhamphus excisus]
MGSEKPNFLSQPVVKNVFMYRNGDPYYEARRIVINQKRVCNFETLLREVTGGVKAPFGAVRNIYTPRGGHRVDCLDGLRSGEQYVAAGRERFKKLDYLQIGSRKKRMMQNLPFQAKPLPPSRISVSARFLKPIKEPCPIFVVANGDTLNPAIRLLVHQRMLSQFERILEMITEKMGLRVLGGVRSLFTYDGQPVSDGTQLESGQLYVAVGRERFKKLSYSDLLFSKPRGARRANGMKMCTLPPIYRFPKQNGNSKSGGRHGDSGGSEWKASPPSHSGSNKEHLSSIVREISQARLLSLRKKRSGQSVTLGLCDNDDLDSKTEDGNADSRSPQDQPAEEEPTSDDPKASVDNGEKAEERKEASDPNTADRDTYGRKEEEADKETRGQAEGDTEDETGAAKTEYDEDVSEEQAGNAKEVEVGSREALDESSEALDDGKDDLEESKDDLDDGKDDLDDGKDDLEESKDDLDDGKDDLEESKDDLKESKDDLEESKDDLEESKDDLEESKDDLEESKDSLVETKEIPADNEEAPEERNEISDENKEVLESVAPESEGKNEDVSVAADEGQDSDESYEDNADDVKKQSVDERDDEDADENEKELAEEREEEVANDNEVTDESKGENKSPPSSEDQNMKSNTKDPIPKDDDDEDENENKKQRDQEKSQ